MNREEQDAIGEPEAPGAGAADGAEATQAPADARLADLQAKADEHWELYLRTRAELDNLRRRGAKELEQAHRFALEKFVGELLPVKDSLELGLAAAQSEAPEVQSLREGSELTLRLLTGVLEKFGVEAIDPQGEKFDPERHQAVSMQPAQGAEPNTVLQVMQKGYSLNGRLLRPAMVVVAQG
ncbi:MAG: nucleotide exchange factor GrpE [Pseudomonadota bacterium]|nr:nucleotide exchange factor GrpE [Pseudomonadota bacterium]